MEQTMVTVEATRRAVSDKAAPDFTTDDARWQAFIQRDKRADGAFYTAVKTTGVYCRPTCAARQPKRENVTFFVSCDAAEQAGFRPCKRCHPRGISLAETNAAIVAEACRTIDVAETAPTLAE